MHTLDPDMTAGPGGAVFREEAGVLWSASEGQVVNAGTFLLCALTFWLVLPMLYAFAKALVTSKHRYDLTDQRLRESSGVIFRSIEELELYRVKDISVQQPPLQALFGRGRVTLLTSDRSTPLVVLNAVPNPIAVADLLRSCVERCRVTKGVREIDG